MRRLGIVSRGILRFGGGLGAGQVKKVVDQNRRLRVVVK
jgi:hypothetical protein